MTNAARYRADALLIADAEATIRRGLTTGDGPKAKGVALAAAIALENLRLSLLILARDAEDLSVPVSKFTDTMAMVNAWRERTEDHIIDATRVRGSRERQTALLNAYSIVQRTTVI